MQPPAAGIQDQQARTWQRGQRPPTHCLAWLVLAVFVFVRVQRLVQSDNAGVTLHFIKVSSSINDNLAKIVDAINSQCSYATVKLQCVGLVLSLFSVNPCGKLGYLCSD